MGGNNKAVSLPPSHIPLSSWSPETKVQYGYNDHLDEDGVFHYYGEGTVGDMAFTHGNRAIRDHSLNEEELPSS